jgi:DNA-binding transcriptional LysR family regulator
VASVVAAASVWHATVAYANEWDSIDCGKPGQAQCVLGAGDTANTPKPTATTSHVASVTPDPVVCADHELALYEKPLIVESGPIDSRQMFQEDCTRNGQILSSRLFMVAPTPSAAAAAAQSAYKRLVLPLPAVAASPALDVPQLTGLPSWLWLKPGTWAPVASTVSAGGVSVTATATPQSVAWSIGDGSTVICPGPGTP